MEQNVYAMIIIGFIFVFYYGRIVKHLYPNSNETCIDPLNKVLVKICGWNIMHIIFFFMLCHHSNATNNFQIHLLISLFGIIWYKYETNILMHNNLHEDCDDENIVYKNLWKPRADDIVFNLLGQILYICYYKLKQT